MNFDIKAIKWEDEKRKKRAELIAEEINKSIHIKKQYTALEFGCGTGLISFCLNDKFEMITLVDTSKGMIDVLNSKIQSFKINNMKAYQIDINEDHTLPDNSYDVIYTSMALHHIMDTKTTIKNLYRLLKKDGYLCIVDLDEEDGSFHKEEKDFNGHNGFNQNELKNVLLETGFGEVVTNTFYKNEKLIEEMKVPYSLFLMVGRKSIKSLKTQILQLENDLLRPEIRQSAEKTSELLADGFTEFCSSGDIYKYIYGQAIDQSTNLKEMDWEITDFEINQLSENCVLATYRLIKHSELNQNKKYSLRSSIWKCFEGKWKMAFHQGTLIKK